MGEEHDMEIDIMHALEDFLDAYDNHNAEMVVSEAIANAMDIKAARIDVELKVDFQDRKTVSFYNNGPAMNRKQFKDYHVIARSSKSKGKGIGFAGIGAKVYLAAWPKAVIHTETTDGKAAHGSEMYVRGGKLKYRFIDRPALKKRGTMYRVSVSSADYRELERNAADIISDTFDPAISGGLAVTLDGRKIKPWNPQCELKKSFWVKAKDKRFRVGLSVTKEDIPGKKLHVQYHVSGKVISTKNRPDWVMEVKPEYDRRIHAYVDAMPISDKLNLTKTRFKSGTGYVFKEIDRHIYNVLKKNGYVGEDSVKKVARNRLSRFFDKLFTDPKYAFLNPEARGGRGPGKGGKGADHAGPREKRDGQSTGDKKRRNRRGGGSLLIITVERPKDRRDGWLNQSNNQIVINTEHPLYIMYKNDVLARNQRIATTITSILITNAVEKRQMDVKEAFELQRNILTLAKDEMWE